MNAQRWWAGMQSQHAAGIAAGYRRGWTAGARWGVVVGLCVAVATMSLLLLCLQVWSATP